MKAEKDPEWYDWQAIKAILQACGRVCRTPTDRGVTYIFDQKFRRLYTEREYLFPNWFKDSVRW